MKSLSVSFTLGKQSSPNNINIKHNIRDFAAKNINPLKSHDNIEFVDENVEDSYHKLFD